MDHFHQSDSDSHINVARDAEVNELHREVNQLCVTSGEHFFIFRYADDQIDEVLQRVARFAASPSFAFSWHDAAVASNKIRDMAAFVRDELASTPFIDETSNDDV
jgi:hypothetical protein